TYGLGGSTPNSASDVLHYKQLRLHETYYRKVGTGLFVGAGYHLDHYFDISDENAQAGKSSPLIDYYGAPVSQSTSSGVSLNLRYDTRDNQINATRGYYGSLSAKVFPQFLGSDDSYQSLLAEFRAYPHAGGRNILAFWTYGWF